MVGVLLFPPWETVDGFALSTRGDGRSYAFSTREDGRVFVFPAGETSVFCCFFLFCFFFAFSTREDGSYFFFFHQ